jgi:fructokinase
MANLVNIICFGEALIDFKAEGHLQFKGYEGGSPMNVAIAASRLGTKVGFATQISTDMFGQALKAYLKQNEVDISLLEESDAPTTLAFVSEKDGDAHFSFISNGAADTLYNPQPRPILPTSIKFVQFGSKSLLDEPTSSSITDIVAMHQDKAVIVFDPNCRPALIHDKRHYEKSLKKWLELSTIVKVSTQDLEWLYPSKSSESIANDWLKLGPKAVIVTNGGEGVHLYRKNQKPIFAASKNVKVVDTVGAGDTFTGGIMVSLLELNKALEMLSPDDWKNTLSFAAHAAAFNCTKAGANPPTRKELEAFMKE